MNMCRKCSFLSSSLMICTASHGSEIAKLIKIGIYYVYPISHTAYCLASMAYNEVEDFCVPTGK